jgi:hypothetical protein
MRVLGLAFAVLLAVTVPIAADANGPQSNMGPANSGPAPGIVLAWDGGGSGGRSGGLSAAKDQPLTLANGTANGGHRIGGQTAFMAGGVLMAAPGSQRTGSTFPGAQSSITPSQIGEAQRAGGVIRSRPF